MMFSTELHVLVHQTACTAKQKWIESAMVGENCLLEKAES